jgi:replicative DNA helicase
MQASALKASDNRTNEVSQITRDLKMAARELDIPIILLSQLSRQSEGRKDHRPILSDLRESGSIEQDADMVLFIYRPDQYRDVSDEERNSGLAEIIVAKNRSGESPTIKVKWVGSITSFLNLEKDADAQSLEETEPVSREPQKIQKEDNATAVIAPDEEEIPLPDAPPASSDEVPVMEEIATDGIEEEPMIIKPMEGGDELLDIWDD